MRSPAFPPRRASGAMRFLVPACLILLCFYFWQRQTEDAYQAPIPQYDDSIYFENEPLTKSNNTPTRLSPGGGLPPYGDSFERVKTTSSSTSAIAATTSSVEAKTSQKPAGPVTLVATVTRVVDAVPTKASSDKEAEKPAAEIEEETEEAEEEEEESTVASGDGTHPIDNLISTADKTFNALLKKESKTLAAAAEAYRLRRGRQPPPGFDVWYKFAKENNAIVVEDFWDQIYHDLNPFWAMSAPLIRKEAVSFEMTINIRNGNASSTSDWFWTKIWLNLIKGIEDKLPDMDIPLNAMDEPRIVVPAEKIDEYMSKAKVKMTKPKMLVNDFQNLPAPEEYKDESVSVQDKKWEQTRPYWEIARRGCPPKSAAREAAKMTDFDHPPRIDDSLAAPHMYEGYVSNFTLSTEFCHQPDLQGLEGIFINPLSVSGTKVLFPLFGGSKLAVNNEILLPAPMYWNEEERFLGDGRKGVPWEEKESQVIWRGVATGGKNTETNWRGFQRHRFVAMNNGTKLRRAEKKSELPVNFVLPDRSYDLAAQRDGRLGHWVDEWGNVSFVDLMCYKDADKGTCWYTSPHFEVTEGVSLGDQFNYKYLPDIDGNSFSGRYLGFLRSNSLPIKATVWREWHDSRLVAWKHFVPMDNRFGDWFGIMEYFMGYGNVDNHDAAAKKIAQDGKEWAEKVLRKEDMQIYVLRLLLEYARVSDERREHMGWVDDLLNWTPDMSEEV